MADQSPKWKRPSDVMVMRKKRKPAVNNARNTKENVKACVPEKTTVAQLSRKRSNPFGCSPSKRRNSNKSTLVTLGEDNKDVSESIDNAEEKSGTFWDILSETEGNKQQLAAVNEAGEANKIEQQRKENAEIQRKMQEESRKSQTEKLKQLQDEHLQDEHVSSRSPPVDWSLCTRMRFISTETFEWCSGLTSADESVGLVGFTQCQKPLVTTCQQGSTKGKDAKYDTHKACMVWIHPNLPWCKLFPRMVADSNVGKPCALFSTNEVQKALLNDWTESLTSAYNMVRHGLCPYFYLCTHQFNVLWRSADTAGQSQVHALLSPTSRGLREAFTKEGIEFSMPLDKRKRKNGDIAESAENTKLTAECNLASEDNAVSVGMSRVNQTVDDDDDDDDDLAQTDEGASSWLQSIGLNSKEYKSLDPDKVKLARDGSQAIDQRAESCILVEGPDTHALLNYLLNCRSCFATTGVQCGLPPTILAPVAFKGSTLKQLKVKSLQIHRTNNEVEQGYGMEISGPILPHTKQRLINLISKTHKQFTVSFSTHMPSAAFNAGVDSSGPAPSELTEEFMDETEQFKRPSHLGKKVIREMQFTDETFSWES